jgi:hypothetical protein
MEITRRIDAATSARVEAIANYKVKERYAIYRNGGKDSSAEITVQTVSSQTMGKEYTQISHSGSAFLRDEVIERVLADEKQMSSAANRENVWITTANYLMKVAPGRVFFNGRECVQVGLTARRKTPYLFNGRAWFDAVDYTIVRLEGSPAQSASIFAGVTTLTRDYAMINGFSMAVHAEAHSHSFLFGDTVLKIDYTGYQITRSPGDAILPAALRP